MVFQWFPSGFQAPLVAHRHVQAVELPLAAVAWRLEDCAARVREMFLFMFFVCVFGVFVSFSNCTFFFF